MSDSINSKSYQSGKIKRKKRKENKILRNMFLLIISIGLWGGIVYYGYMYAKEYVDKSISSVNQNNIMLVEQLKEEVKIINSDIKRLSNEIKDLKEEVRDADSTLSDSNNIQEDIDKKLKNLDDRLEKLKESLKILEEAPNVKN
ncbi:coiled-coil domain-containing protein [Maledivibacter halophilus]|uniref:Uncharacterized protein n=1 Tax=Maledivibacter halophilus TaxID=36842 RepID=A0A1T5MU32_9FIRM|nr:hypothetical protein [Maledivibacter halophilus]SKC91544.1 hypothetical protein SAMN02194393_05339 [Maledivibacter halophilus]